MPTVILAHRAEIYTGDDEEIFEQYIKNRKIEWEKFRNTHPELRLPDWETHCNAAKIK